MAAITASEFSINSSGDIRVATSPQIHSVLELHAWLQDMADDASSTGDDVVSILSSNPSRLDGPRSAVKPMFLNLLSTFNIDDTAAQYFKFGSISQDSGDTLYTGVKSIGSPLVTDSPLYVVQNGNKITEFWDDGHIQILVKGKDSGTLIDGGDIYVYSRKYGQTYSNFPVNLSAGGEQPAAISTELTSWTTLDLTSALALSTKVAITIGDTTQSTGDVNGPKLYKGTITLSGGITIAEAAQYLQAIGDEASTTTINGVLGWKYKALDASYTPNTKAPFGEIAGGKWLVAQGWWISGALAADSQNYQMTSHDGTPVTNPVVTVITIGDLVAGVRILVARDDGAGSYIDDEYTLNGIHGSTLTTVTVNEAIKADTPETGYIRVGGVPYTYSTFNSGTKQFTLTGQLGGSGYASGTECFVPFLDMLADSTEETSANFTFSSQFNARLIARKGTSPSYKPFTATFPVTSAGGAINAILDSDE
jgi:hypothetical protein